MRFADWLERGYDTLISVSPPTAGIKDAGKRPARRNADGTWYSPKGWNDYRVDPSDLPTWEKWGANLGLVNKGQFFILDIDSYDEQRAASIEATAKVVFGDAPRRVGQWPKRALLYRTDEPIEGIVMPYKEGEATHRVETTAINGQIVIQGIHPRSGNPYEWDREIPRYEDLTLVTRDKVENFFARLQKHLPEARRQTQNIDTGPGRDPEALKGDQELVLDALARIPNNDSVEYADYITVGQAVRGAFGPGFEDEAYEAWDAWSRKSPKYDEALNEKHWRTMGQSRTVGAQYLFGRASKHGWDREHEVFFGKPDPVVVQEQKPARSGFRLIMACDLKLTPPDYLIDDLIETGTLGVIFGAPSAWKSFASVHIAACIATGTPFFGHAVQQGPVIYLAGEGQAGLARRRAAWEIGTGVSLKGAPLYFSNMTARMLEPAHTAEIAEAVDEIVKQHGVPKIVFIDTTAKAMVGGDENNTADMTRLLASAEAMQRRYPGCVIQLVHHTGVADPRRLRGSSALKGGVDSEFLMIKEDGVAAFENLKMKDGPMAPTMYFTAEEIILGTTSKGKQFGSLTLRQAQEPVKTKKVTKAMQLGVDTFMDALRTIGNDLTAGVPVDIWRSHFMSKHTADSAHAKRVAFTRTRKDLVDGGFLGVADDVYRLISLPSGVTFEQCDEDSEDHGHPFG